MSSFVRSTVLPRTMIRAQVQKSMVNSRLQLAVTPLRVAQAVRFYTSPSSSTQSSPSMTTLQAEAKPFSSNVSASSSQLVSSVKDLIVDNHRIVAGVVLSRQPLITRDLSDFEREYFEYQKDLERDHAAAFGAEFYFKKGSVAERRWKQQENERLAAKAASKSGSSSSSPTPSSSKSAEEAASSIDSMAEDDIPEEDRVAALESQVDFNPRETAADQNKDMRSLERALSRTLYLIVKKPREQHAWQFAQGGVHVHENLQEAASRELKEECGDNMDLWFVGRVPIGHYQYKYPSAFLDAQKKDSDSGAAKAAKVFFMKAHIFAGQVQVDNKEIVDYAWVTKQEMKDYVSSDYYDAVKDMLTDL